MSLRVRAILALLPLLATALLALTLAAPSGAWAADLTLVHPPSSERGGSSAREWRWERAEREAGPERERVRSALKGSHDARARQCAPQLRQWVEPAPLVYADSLDRWLFNAGDPIRFIDPWGRDSRPPNEDTGGAGDVDRDRGGRFSRWLERIRNGGDGTPEREPSWEPVCEWGCGEISSVPEPSPGDVVVETVVSADAGAMHGAPEPSALFGPLQPFVQVYDYVSDEYSQLQVGPLLGNLTPVDLSLSHEISGETDRALDTLEWIGAIASVGLRTGPAGVGEIAAGSVARAVHPAMESPGAANTITHIFGRSAHQLEGLVTHFGSREAAYTALYDATQVAVRAQGTTGVFQTAVNVAGQSVTERGNVIDGVLRLSTAFVP